MFVLVSCEFNSASKNDVSIHIEDVHRKSYTETDSETSLEDNIPKIDGEIDDEAAEDDAHVKKIIESKIRQVKAKKLRNMSNDELNEFNVEVCKYVMVKMLKLKLFKTFNCGASNIKAIVSNLRKNYMKAS